MQQLPKGYYAVKSDFENSHKDVFVFRGTSYAVTEGETLFASINEAAEAAAFIPTEVIDGLPYSELSAPVLLFSEGEHSVERFVFKKSLILLGEGAGITPNLPSDDIIERPALNPEREKNESVLCGSYWFGHMTANAAAAETVVVDGFTFNNVRFKDTRTGGEKAYVSFRNIIHKSHCGWNLYDFASPAEASSLDREVHLQNIRLTDFDDLDYAANFILLSAHKATLEGICYDSTSQIFGLSNITHGFSNCAANFDATEINIRGCYFGNMQGENAVSYSYGNTEEKILNVKVTDCVFVNAGREGKAALRPNLAGENSRLTVKNCTFVDKRGNNGAAISVFGGGTEIEIDSCCFEGYTCEWTNEPVMSLVATDCIENSAEGFVTECEDPHRVIGTTKADFSELDSLYDGTKAYYGDLHVHTKCGGTSDGSYPMADWPAKMDEIKVDFAAVVDHRQMRGFFLPEWDEERFIIGTEPAAQLFELNSCRHEQREIHYNMLFPSKYGLAMVLANFPEFEFKGDELNGSFKYPSFTKARFGELTEFVKSIGGMMVHPHPKTMLSSDDPLDYYFGEHTYLETLYGTLDSHASFKNYDLWVKLLALGKHVYASGGSDTHRGPSNKVVSVFYTREKSGKAFFDQMHTGDFTVGSVGMKMVIDGHPMGSEIEYKDSMKLTLRLDDFFEPTYKEDTAYELRIYTDRGLAYSSIYNGKLPQELSLEVQKRAFYRAEVFDLTHEYRVAVGNPIWLS